MAKKLSKTIKKDMDAALAIVAQVIEKGHCEGSGFVWVEGAFGFRMMTAQKNFDRPNIHMVDNNWSGRKYIVTLVNTVNGQCLSVRQSGVLESPSVGQFAGTTPKAIASIKGAVFGI